MDAAEARRRFSDARVARLATVSASGQPHLVPVVFAVAGDEIYTAVDEKPKTTTALRRLDNVRANPRVSLLVDRYDDGDWSALWWARADGVARVVDAASDEGGRAIDALADRYAQHRAQRPPGPALVISVSRWSGWSAS